MLFENIDSRFPRGFKVVWILLLRKGPAECFLHRDTDPSIIRKSKLPNSAARSPNPGDVPQYLVWVRSRPNYMLWVRVDFSRLSVRDREPGTFRSDMHAIDVRVRLSGSVNG
jgi:hypothetical protein